MHWAEPYRLSCETKTQRVHPQKGRRQVHSAGIAKRVSHHHRWDERATCLRVHEAFQCVSDAFRWNAKPNGEIFLELTNKNDFCVLVDIPEDTNVGPKYYVVPTPVIDKWLKDDFQTWVTTPGVKGQQRAKDNRQRIFHLDGDPMRLSYGYRQKLAPFKGEWEGLARI